jgi:dTDP-4-dehydrorhamnose reductase
MASILVLGGSGLVGSRLVEILPSKHVVTATFNSGKVESRSASRIRLTFPEALGTLRLVVEQLKPDVIVNTVGHPSVDFCEMHPEEAYQLHVQLVEEICKSSRVISAKVIHLSTDYVFDGTNPPYSEESTPVPLNYYGITKLVGEKVVLSSSSDNIVLRPAFIYGWHTKARFLNLVLSSLKNGKRFEAYIDQYSCPTLVNDLVRCIIKGIDSDVVGLFNVVGSSCINRFEFARSIAIAFGLNSDLIGPVLTKKNPQLARRPMRNCLVNSKATSSFGVDLATVEQGLVTVSRESMRGIWEE